MAITISVSSTVGGSCKTTVACLFAYFLGESYKTLVIDLCSQCHATELLSGHVDLTEEGTICDAFDKGDIVSSIRPITNTLHIVPGNMWIGTMSASLYRKDYSASEVVAFLCDFINQAKATYDFVVIDTPGTSAEELFNLSLFVSDFAIMTFSPTKLNLINQWMNRINHVQNTFNPNLRVGGILRTRFNKIEALHKYSNQEVLKHYPEHCWNNVFPTASLFANLDIYGIEKKRTVSAFKAIYDELLLRLLKTQKGV